MEAVADVRGNARFFRHFYITPQRLNATNTNIIGAAYNVICKSVLIICKIFSIFA